MRQCAFYGYGVTTTGIARLLVRITDGRAGRLASTPEIADYAAPLRGGK